MGEQFEGSTGGKVWLAAIVCGPAAGAIILLALQLIAVLVAAASGGISGSNTSLGVIFGGAIFGALIGWPAMLLFGLPAHIFLYRRKSRKVGGYLLCGILIGFVAVLAALLLIALGGGFAPGSVFAAGAIGLSFFCLVGSVLASWLFWLIRRPDKDTLQPNKVAAMFE